jgi:hypothetical protein
MKRKLLIGAVALVVVYVLSYGGFRQTHTEVWERDSNAYVIFPSAGLYYAYRPLTYADAFLTGMRFHIGPHQ